MRKRPLGASQISASVVGLGTWQLGGWMWGAAVRQRDAVSTIHAALDQGVDLVDTAPVYGLGFSEETVGRALQGRRDRAVLATKCGMICHNTLGEPKFNSNALGVDPQGIVPVRIHLHPESIRCEIEGSLRRLKTDYIDLYQTHWQTATTPAEETMGALMELKQEGKIRAIGVCNATVDDMERYQKVGPLDCDQEQYSMLDRQRESRQWPYCQKHNIAVLAYSPLARGLLTGKLSPEREFPDGDVRRADPRFRPENRRRIAQMFEHLKPIAENHRITLAQLTIAWTVHQPGVTHALCGARSVEHAQENAAAGDVELSAEELQTINEAVGQYAGAAVG